MFKDILSKIISKQDLDSVDMREVFNLIMNGETTDSQNGAFLAALRTKGETINEVTTAASVMRKHAKYIDAGAGTVIDTCGTGGSGLDIFNVSTACAFVSAAAGVAVAKHGNRAVSGSCGSADVLVELGYNLDVSSALMEECLQEENIAFLFAPYMHPSMRYVMPARKELGIRTIFNILGPLSNPAGATGQLLGVFDSSLTEMFAGVLKELGTRRAMIVHGEDGLDEITCTGITKVSELRNGEIKNYNIDFETLMGDVYDIEDIAGGSPEKNAAILKDVLEGKKGAARDIVLINSAAAIMVGEKAETLEEGLTIAREAIDSGAALEKLKTLIEYSNK